MCSALSFHLQKASQSMISDFNRTHSMSVALCWKIHAFSCHPGQPLPFIQPQFIVIFLTQALDIFNNNLMITVKGLQHCKTTTLVLMWNLNPKLFLCLYRCCLTIWIPQVVSVLLHACRYSFIIDLSMIHSHTRDICRLRILWTIAHIPHLRQINDHRVWPGSSLFTIILNNNRTTDCINYSWIEKLLSWREQIISTASPLLITRLNHLYYN